MECTALRMFTHVTITTTRIQDRTVTPPPQKKPPPSCEGAYISKTTWKEAVSASCDIHYHERLHFPAQVARGDAAGTGVRGTSDQWDACLRNQGLDCLLESLCHLVKA